MIGEPSGCLPALVTWPVRRRTGGRRRVARRAPAPAAETFGRGVALRGRLWPGAGPGDSAGAGPVLEDGIVIVDGTGRIAVIGPTEAVTVPSDLPVVEAVWIGPGIVDAYVHLAGTGRSPAGLLEDELRAGVVAVRDLGSPAGLRTGGRGRGGPSRSAVAGSGAGLVLEVGPGRPSGGRSSVIGESGSVIGGPAAARRAVAQLAMDGVDLIRVVVAVGNQARGRRAGVRPDEARADGEGAVATAVLSAVVTAAHAAGLPVTATAMSVAAVRTALAAGVDELAQVPVEPLPDAVIEAIATAGLGVVSTLQTTSRAGRGSAGNAAALHRAGVTLRYGTDLGGPGTVPGVDHRELDRLAYAGLGRAGALVAATAGSARAVGLAGRPSDGRIIAGQRAAVVALAADPLIEPAAWRGPSAVVCGSQVLRQ